MENANGSIILLLYFEFLLVLFNFLSFVFMIFLYPFVLEKCLALVVDKKTHKALRNFVGVLIRHFFFTLRSYFVLKIHCLILIMLGPSVLKVSFRILFLSEFDRLF